MPPRTSRPMVDPRSVILKKPSIPEGLVGRTAAALLSLTAPQCGRPAPRAGPAPRGRVYLVGVDLGDEQPAQHEIGNRTYIVANVAPLDVDGVRTVEVGTALWFIAFLGLLPFYGTLEESGRTWWLWTCLAGFGLGLFGLDYCRRRRRTRAEQGAGA